jgi:colicin import membrane protein
MAERKDNSALIALSELRAIEEDRVKQEEEDERLKLETFERKKRDEEEARRRAEEAKRAAEEAARKAVEESRRKETVEGQLRLQEAERRARIEAEAHLAAKRIEAESMAMAHAKKPPLGLIFGIIGGLVVVGGGIITYFAMQSNEAKRQAEAARLEKDEIERANLDYKKDIAAAGAALDRKLASAKSAEDIAKAKAENEAAQREAEERRVSRAKAASARRSTAGPAPDKPAGKVKGISTSDDPLGGLKGK